MLKYNCSHCNFYTNNRTDYYRHLKTIKHKNHGSPDVPKNIDIISSSKKEQDITYIENNDSTRFNEIQRKDEKTCKFCGISFTTSTNYNRHLKTCEERKTVQENEKLKAKIIEQGKQIKEYKIEKEYYKKLIDNYSKLGPKTFNSITYVMNKYADAPHIEKMEPEKIEYFQDISMTTVENLVSDYRNNLFVDFIIKTIITMHKKDDPKDQSIWSTDSSRYNYLIKELLENEDSYWVVDIKGSKSKTYIIEPILRFIRKEIIKYNELASDAIIDTKLPKKRFSIITDTQRYGIDIIKDIDNGVLAADIIKKMAKHFYHKSKNLPLIEEIE